MGSEIPQLRVVGVDGLVQSPAERAPGGLSAGMRLSQFFYEYAWPQLFQPSGDCQRTFDAYEQAVRKWAAYTGDPPLGKIDKSTCSRFIRLLAGELYRGRKLSDQTLRKHGSAIQRLLDRAGPEDRNNRGGAEILEKAPWLMLPRASRPEPKSPLTLVEIWKWLEAAHDARRTAKITGCEASVWWRAQILFCYNTGLRSGSLMTARWEMIRDRWLSIPGELYKGGSGHMIWLNDPALEAIHWLPRRSGVLFPWHFTQRRSRPPGSAADCWERTHQEYNRQRRQMQEQAGIRPQGLQALRQRFATEASKISPPAAQIQMGHSGSVMRMAREHYLDAEDILSHALQQLPQPGPANQQRLF